MTRANVLLIGLAAFLLGGIGYGSFLVFGFNPSNAGIASEALLVLVIVAWIVSYFSRVVGGKMTFMEQRKRYRQSYEDLTQKELQKRFDSMSEEERKNLMKDLEIDKNDMAEDSK